MVNAAETTRDTIVARTKQGVSSDGGAFTPLRSEKYATRKARRTGRGSADLWFTGFMLGNLSVLGGAGQRTDIRGRGSKTRSGTGNTGQFAKFEIVLGFPAPKYATIAAAHEFGASRSKGGNLPRRPFMGLTTTDIDSYTEKVGRGISQALTGGSKGAERLEVRLF
jgi:hypothetical protein